jgi:hypothetical protein
MHFEIKSSLRHLFAGIDVAPTSEKRDFLIACRFLSTVEGFFDLNI